MKNSAIIMNSNLDKDLLFTGNQGFCVKKLKTSSRSNS